MAAPSRLRQNLFDPSMIFHIELLGAVLEPMEYLHPPKVVEGGYKGKMDTCLSVELPGEVPVCGEPLSLSFGLLGKEHGSMEKERGEHPCQDDGSPARVVGKQGEEGEQVRCDIYRWR